MRPRPAIDIESFQMLSEAEKLKVLNCLRRSTGWPSAGNTRDVLFEFEYVYVTASFDRHECKVIELNFFQASECNRGTFWKVVQIVPGKKTRHSN